MDSERQLLLSKPGVIKTLGFILNHLAGHLNKYEEGLKSIVLVMLRGGTDWKGAGKKSLNQQRKVPSHLSSSNLLSSESVCSSSFVSQTVLWLSSNILRGSSHEQNTTSVIDNSKRVRNKLTSTTV